MSRAVPRRLRGALVWSAVVVVLLGGWVGALTARNAGRAWLNGTSLHQTNALRMAVKQIVTELIEPYYDSRLVRTTTLPIYDLELSPRRHREWLGMLDRVVRRGRALPEDQQYIPARFRVGDQIWDVKIRGRGAIADHYREAKPSFRVRFPASRYFRGRRVINLIIPYDKLGTDAINEVAREYGILTYPTRFVVVRLNGEVLGVYQEVEHFRKELAVLQRRSEGYFFNAKGEGKGGADEFGPTGIGAAVELLRSCGEACDSATAERLWADYVDREKMAAFAALTTLVASSHAWAPDNLMLFLDPARGTFEPVPWDVGIRSLVHHRPDPDEPFETAWGLADAFLAHDEFRERRNVLLWEMLEHHVDRLVAASDAEYERLRPSLDWDLEHSRRYSARAWDDSRRWARDNAERLAAQLERADLLVEVGDDGLRLVNRAMASQRVRSVTLLGEDGRRTTVEVERTVPGRFRTRPGRLFVSATVPPAPRRVEVDGSNHVTGAPLPAGAVSLQRVAGRLAPPPVPLPPKPIPPAGVAVEGDGDLAVWTFRGTVRIERDLVLPDGASAVFEGGARILLGPGASLVVRGDLTGRGTATAPVVVRPIDRERPFGSLAVLGWPHAPARVELVHTVVEGGSESDYGAVHFSGALAVHDGSLRLVESTIRRSAGEDGVNVKYGSVELRDSTFEDNASDALDLDFCTGFVRGNAFLRSGGDAIDFSGSELEVAGNRLESSGDKGISVGEATTVQLVGNSVRGAVTGIAVKDRSHATLVDNTIVDVDVGIAVYRKKPVFGSATVDLRSGTIERARTRFLTDPEAELLRASR